PQKPFAVAVNTVFVPKGAYAETVLNENDKIDIVRPVVGG
ncbi:sulfur carrier protein ThiS, partial [Neisseria meningitidis]